MKTKIFLTSILAITFAMPAFARAGGNVPTDEPTVTVQPGVGGSEQCDTATLGQSENNSTANVEAIWVPNTYGVQYRLNPNSNVWMSCKMIAGMSGSAACMTPTYGESFTFAPAATKEGYAFAGWSCIKQNSSGGYSLTPLPFSGGQTITWEIDGDLRCTAQWTANTINIDWNPQNGDAHTLNTCTYGETITLPTEPTRTGYTFTGWQLKPCDTYNSSATCPTSRCQWNTDTNVCEDHLISANCARIADEESCVMYDNCSWENNECIDENTNIHDTDMASGCEEIQSEESCSADSMCIWNNGSCNTFESYCNGINDENACTAQHCYWHSENSGAKCTSSSVQSLLQ